MGIQLPRPFVAYQCERSLVCCRDPIRAPCDPDEEARIAALLAKTERGRSRLPVLHTGIEEVQGLRAFKQVDHDCVHLARRGELGPEPACHLHHEAGIEALAPACRNYPRWIARVIDDPPASPNTIAPAPADPTHAASASPAQAAQAARADQIEAVFLLACPTAAKLLVRDPAPFSFVEVTPERFPFAPVRDERAPFPLSPEPTPADADLAGIRRLRDAWWAYLAVRRDDPAYLLHALAAWHVHPLEPLAPEAPAPAELLPNLLDGLSTVEARVVIDALENLPDRGPNYALARWDLWRDLTRPISPRDLLAACDIAPNLVAAFLDHVVAFIGLHDGRPASTFLRAMVRRAVALIRGADALIARVPFAIDTLFADLFVAATHLEPTP